MKPLPRTLLLALALVIAPSWAGAQETRAPDEGSIEVYREPFERLSERMVGATSRAVRFDWRRSSFGLEVFGGELLERNLFNSLQLGGAIRLPFSGMMAEIGLSRVTSSGGTNADTLALTPYREAGRPDRLELDLNLAIPLAEGVVTLRPGSAAEMVFSGVVGVRYAIYPQALSKMKSPLAPSLSEAEIGALDSHHPAAMTVDPARYHPLLGVSIDTYFSNGIFIAPRAMVSPPLMQWLGKSELGWWWELNVAVGWML